MDIIRSSRIMKWVSGGLEALLAVPLLGAAIIIGLYWFPLFVMFCVHLATLILSIRDKTTYHGSILGIITSMVAWIPFVGWILHIITAALLLVDASRREEETKSTVTEGTPQNVINVVSTSNVGHSEPENKGM